MGMLAGWIWTGGEGSITASQLVHLPFSHGLLYGLLEFFSESGARIEGAADGCLKDPCSFTAHRAKVNWLFPNRVESHRVRWIADSKAIGRITIIVA
jgi:hypothetical protein